MFKDNFKAAFGLITGLAAGCWVVSFIDNLIKEAKIQCKETEEKQEEKKEDIWEETLK